MSTPTNENATELIAELGKLSLNAENINRDTKLEAWRLSKKLASLFEDPFRRAIDLAFQPYDSVAARIAVELDLFTHISNHNSITSNELAKITGGDEVLIGRILRLLATQDFVFAAEHNVWNATEITHAMASGPIAAGHRVMFDIVVNSAVKAPQFLVETDFKCPTESANGILQFGLGTKWSFYDYLLAWSNLGTKSSLVTRSNLFDDFNLFMSQVMASREYWHEWYDVQGRVLSGYHESFGPLLVDVGGGKGHDLQAFYDKYGREHEGALVLQDKEPVLDSIDSETLHTSIKKVPHDFFTPQPKTCRKARVYFLHHILHNWNDLSCILILAHLRAAMKPGYSKLLILDFVLPDITPREMQARFDLTMMTCNGGMERSRAQWQKLLEDAGFEVTGIFERKDSDGVVEAMVKD